MVMRKTSFINSIFFPKAAFLKIICFVGADSLLESVRHFIENITICDMVRLLTYSLSTGIVTRKIKYI